MANRDIVVIGASAGGIEALQQFLVGIPSDLPAAVLVVLHTSSHADSLLPQIMQRASKLPVIHPTDKTPIEKGRVYIAPPDYHMILEDSMVRVLQGPRENLHRPAIDPLFRSAAAAHGRRVIGVVLTGLLDDGTSGLMVVRAAGGEAIVQDPATALFPSMPRNALKQVPDAHVLAVEKIPDLVVNLVREELPDGPPATSMPKGRVAKETRYTELDMAEIENEKHPGQPSAFACPDCGGVLWELDEDNFLRFRCRVGHAFTAKNLGFEQRHAIETALWSALRALEENASLFKRLAERAENGNSASTSGRFRDRAANISANARVLRDFLLDVSRQSQDEMAATEEA